MDFSFVDSSVALFVGHSIGTVSDRVVAVIDERLKMNERLSMDSTTGSLLDSVLGIFLHVGLISVGTKLATNALPNMISDPSAFALFMMGIVMTSQHLAGHLKVINTILLDEKIYSKATNSQEKVIENGPKPKEEAAAPSS